jgi:hypothetical protein
VACDGNQGRAHHRAAARLLLWQVELLWRRQIIDYILLRAVRP